MWICFTTYLDFFSNTGLSSSMNSDLSDLTLVLFPDSTRSTTFTLDHTTQIPLPCPFKEIDIYVNVLLLACSQQFKDEEKELRQLVS